MLDEVLDQFKNCKQYDGSYDQSNKSQNIFIQRDSKEVQLITTYMQQRCGFRMTTYMVNEHRSDEGNEEMCWFTVMTVFYKMQPLVTQIRKVQSGEYIENWIHRKFENFGSY